MSNIGFFRRAPECRDENEKSILLMKVIPETQNTIEQDVKIERREEIKKLIEYIESKACVNIIYKF